MTRAPTTIERIEAFVKQWPGSEYGPACILLDDYNVSNSHVLSCMRAVAKELGSKPGDKELTATFVFLLSISEVDEWSRWRECWPDEEPSVTALSRSPLFR